MKKKLLVATRNSGKVLEFSRILSGMLFDVVSLDDLGIDLEVEESEISSGEVVESDRPHSPGGSGDPVVFEDDD